MNPGHKFRSGQAARRAGRALSLALGAILLASLLVLRTSGVAPSAAPAAFQQADAQSLLSTADAVFKDMSEITGLPIRTPLKRQIVSRPEIRQYLTENLKQEYTPRELHQQESMLKAFGLVSREFDLEKFTVDFYTEQAAGVYDPRRKTMFIADWVAPAMQKMVLAHELTHALQDQNYDLEKFEHAVREDDDASNARQAVVEGYATAAMIAEQIKPVALESLPALAPMMNMMIQKPMTEFPAYTNAPFFFRYSALFPYSEGIGFMQTGLAHGGWKRLNQSYTRPPTTTKEIFEPDLYFGSGGSTILAGGSASASADPPPPPPLPKIALPHPAALDRAAGLSLLAENDMGQLGYYCVLGQFISEDEARKLAPGWTADRYLIYENGSTHQLVLVARTRWSSAEMALAFFRDYHTILGKKFTELTPDPRSTDDAFVGSTASGQVILIRQGDECRWTEGVPAAQTDAMLAWLRKL